MKYNLIILMLPFLFTSCHYYKLDTVKENKKIETSLHSNASDYIILHTKDSAWHLSNPVISDGKISGRLVEVDPIHKKYQEFKNRSKDYTNYSKKKQWKYQPGINDPRGELHIYVREKKGLIANSSVDIVTDDILFVDIAAEDDFRRKRDFINAGLTVGAIGVIILLVIGLK